MALPSDKQNLSSEVFVDATAMLAPRVDMCFFGDV